MTAPHADRQAQRLTKVRLVSLFDALHAGLWQPATGWDDPAVVATCEGIASSGFIGRNWPLACVVFHQLAEQQPDTVRGCMYSAASTGWLPDTSDVSYNRAQRILRELRKREIVPYHWIVDNLRSTEKPSTWDGLADFVDTVQDSYRKDFWKHLPSYVCVIIEKDAAAGRIVPVTREYDVALHPLRGFSSTTFAYTIGSHWRRIPKPIHAYYIGDHDPSGRAIEQTIRRDLEEFARRPFTWTRLAVEPEQFDRFNILPLKPKKQDTRYQRFVERYGHRCAEVEAIPAEALRGMVSAAIEQHIPQDEWAPLKRIERAERTTWEAAMRLVRETAA